MIILSIWFYLSLPYFNLWIPIIERCPYEFAGFNTEIQVESIKVILLQLTVDNFETHPAVVKIVADHSHLMRSAVLCLECLNVNRAIEQSRFEGMCVRPKDWHLVMLLSVKRETGRILNSALNGRGGGKPEMIMGSLSAKAEEIKTFIKDLSK